MPKKVSCLLIQLHGKTLRPAELDTICDILGRSGVIIFPTDTVYGVACNAFDPMAIKKVYALKGRHYSKPLPIMLGNAQQLPLIAADIFPETKPLIETYWPGALTLVFKSAPMAVLAAHGRNSIAVRIPDHGVVRQILQAFQLPLAVTSANISNKKSMVEGEQVRRQFENRVDLIVDGGRCHRAQESSIVDVTHYPFTILREGAISKADLAKTLKLA